MYSETSAVRFHYQWKLAQNRARFLLILYVTSVFHRSIYFFTFMPDDHCHINFSSVTLEYSNKLLHACGKICTNIWWEQTRTIIRTGPSATVHVLKCITFSHAPSPTHTNLGSLLSVERICVFCARREELARSLARCPSTRPRTRPSANRWSVRALYVYLCLPSINVSMCHANALASPFQVPQCLLTILRRTGLCLLHRLHSSFGHLGIFRHSGDT